jgi:hypothetical protein
MKQSDYEYCTIPWLMGGRTRAGADCVGLVRMFLEEELGVTIDAPEADGYSAAAGQLLKGTFRRPLDSVKRGDVLFFEKAGVLSHVAVAIGNGKVLHSTMCGARVDNGIALIERAGLKLAGVLSAEEVGQSLSIPTLGVVWVAIALVIVSVALTFALRPKMPNFKDQFGRYGASGSPLATLVSTEQPLPDVLGELVLAGNAVFQTPIDKEQTTVDATQQKISRVVVFANESTALADWRINSISFISRGWANETVGGITKQGFQVNPSAADLAVSGIIAGYATKFCSFNEYSGPYAITVPVDIRAQYEREFPVYGFPGCAYTVFRFIDMSKFQNGFNVTASVTGHKVRTFDTNGFVTSTATNESLSGADGTKVRFKMAQSDIKAITAITVNGTAYTEISATNQAGNIYQLNRTKGFVEFVTAPAAAATILVSYSYYVRATSSNPAALMVYLLTASWRGKGFDESRINWPYAVDLRDYCDQTVTWNTGTRGPESAPRYQANYVLDVRKPLSDHLRALLDSCHAQLFISAGKVCLRSKKNGSSVFSFNTSNILVENGKSSFRSQLMDRADRNNRVNLFYRGAESFNSQTGVIRDDAANQAERAPRVGNDGLVEEFLQFNAVDEPGQAERLAATILAEEVNTRWNVEFKTNIKGLALEPTDLIDVTHPSRPAWSQKVFRIEEINVDDKDYLKIRASEYFEGAYL